MLRLPLAIACILLCINSIRAQEPVTSDETASTDSQAIVDQETASQEEIAEQQDAEKEAIKIEGERLAKQAAEQTAEREQQQAERSSDVVVASVQPESLGKLPSEIEAEEKAEQAATIEKQSQAVKQRSQQGDASQQTYAVRPNAYGLGVNSDQFGRPHAYRTQDGETLVPIFQGGVKRNAYGAGVHSDQFGRPVYDGKP